MNIGSDEWVKEEAKKIALTLSRKSFLWRAYEKYEITLDNFLHWLDRHID